MEFSREYREMLRRGRAAMPDPNPEKKFDEADGLCAAIAMIIVLTIVLLVVVPRARGEEIVDMHKIMMIESHGDPLAWRKQDDSIGLYQITPIVLKEWNNFHSGQKHVRRDLFNPAVNTKIARWYLNQRIPQMLRAYGRPVTIENVIVAYNAGISYVVNRKPLPRITRAYLVKYNGAGQ